MRAEAGILVSLAIAFTVAGTARKVSVETGRMVLLDHLKEDWTYRLPFHFKNNRYRDLSRTCYQLLATLYYIVKAIVIIALCGYYYILAGLCIAIKWIWKKASPSESIEIIDMKQERASGSMANNHNAAQRCHAAPAEKQASGNAGKEAAPQSVGAGEHVVSSLWNHGSEAAWHEAFEHYYALLNTEAQELDSYMEHVAADEIAQLSAADFYDFLYNKYFVWKYTQKNRLATTRKALRKYVDENKLSELANVQRRLFLADRSNIGKCLRIATEIRGLGPAGASGLLSILFPEDFGTVDQFVVKALREVHGLSYAADLAAMNPESLSIENGILLIKIMREQAQNLNKRFDTDFWTPRKIDMVLWAIGR